MMRWLQIGVPVAAVAVAAVALDWKAVVDQLRVLDLRFVLLSFAGGWVTVFLAAVKLQLVAGAQGPLSGRRALSAVLAGKAFGLALPSTLSSDVGTALAITERKRSFALSASIVFADRLISLSALLLLSLLLMPWELARMPPALRGVVVTTVAAATVVVVAIWGLVTAALPALTRRFHPLLPEQFRRIVPLDVRQTLVRNRGRFGAAAAVSLLMQMNVQLATYFLLHAARLQVPLLYAVAVLPVNSLALLVPASIGGIGIREGGFFLLLSPFRVAMARIVAFCLVGYLFDIIAGAVGAILRFATAEDKPEKAGTAGPPGSTATTSSGPIA
jgi:glycosyltransferase 2 family protein